MKRFTLILFALLVADGSMGRHVFFEQAALGQQHGQTGRPSR